MFLFNVEQSGVSVKLETRMNELAVGQTRPVNAFTNNDSLGALIKKFNALPAVNHDHRVDESIVDLRDALAHGRSGRSSRARRCSL